MKILSLLITPIYALAAMSLLFGAETLPVKKPGIKTLQLVSDQDAVVPGQELSIGLFIQHLPEYHTYWKAPGIVGVPTTVDWQLPKGFSAGELEWPLPEISKMAEYTCYGYERDVCLLTRIAVPEKIEADSVTIKARVAFMCCAKTCHPGWHDFEMTFPVNQEGKTELDRKWSKKFIETRREQPGETPEDWTLEITEGETTINIQIEAGKTLFPNETGIYCFSEDNQVHSDKPQTITRSRDKRQLSLSLIKSGFGPEGLKRFSGLLFHPDGWPGTSSKWIFIEAPINSAL